MFWANLTNFYGFYVVVFFFTTTWKLKIKTNWKVSMNFDALFYFKKVDKNNKIKI